MEHHFLEISNKSLTVTNSKLQVIINQSKKRKGNEAQPALGETYVLTKGIDGVEADVREGKYRKM